MVSIDSVESEVVVENAPPAGREAADKPDEVRIEELRAIVRELLEEEYVRYRRTEAER